MIAKTISSDKKANPKLRLIRTQTATEIRKNVGNVFPRSDVRRRVLEYQSGLFFLPCFSATKAAADDLFGEADDISSDSDAEKPPTPGQPLVSICSPFCCFVLFFVFLDLVVK